MKTCITCTYYVSTDEILHGCSHAAKVEAFIDVVTGEGVNRVAIRSCRIERIAGATFGLVVRVTSGRWPCGRSGRHWKPAAEPGDKHIAQVPKGSEK